MDSVLHTYLTKLRIISKIPERGRLDTTQNDLNIYYPTVANWMWRKFNGDSKDSTTKYLLVLYRDINTFSEQLMHSITTENNTTSKNRKIIMLVSLNEKIKESINGIRNLLETYKDYLKVVSLLECLEQDIIMPQLNILKKFIPLEFSEPSQPIAAQPIAAQPIAAQPIAAQPIAAQPIAAQPIAAQPIAQTPVVKFITENNPEILIDGIVEPRRSSPIPILGITK